MLPKRAIIVAGAPKAGTTTLHDALAHHKDLLMPIIKEPSFFNDDENYSWGINYYFEKYYPGLQQDSMIVDCSPLYAKSKKAANRIKLVFGSRAKIVLVLRNPVDRAYSHYLHNRRDEIYGESIAFEQALSLKGAESLDSDCVSYSKYYEMINIWVSEFGKGDVLLLKFEDDIVSDLQAGIDKVCDFSGIERIRVKDNIESNPAKKSKTGFSWLRRGFFSDSKIKRLIKPIIPPLHRHKFRLLFNELTSTEIKLKNNLDNESVKNIYEKYFKEEMESLKRDYNIDYLM